MAYCTRCGQTVPLGGRFCPACGASAPGANAPGASLSPGPPQGPLATVAVPSPRRGEWLALQGFLLALGLGVILTALIRGDRGRSSVAVTVAFGAGAAYILARLRRWKRRNETVKRAALAWIIFGFLLFVCLGGLLRPVVGPPPLASPSGGPSPPRAAAPADAPDPKDVLRRDVKVELHRTAGTRVMVADFTVTNPTSLGFKDFRVRCTHFAPSGTVVDTSAETIYDVVEPRSKKVVRNIAMSHFVHAQIARSACAIADAKLVP